MKVAQAFWQELCGHEVSRYVQNTPGPPLQSLLTQTPRTSKLIHETEPKKVHEYRRNKFILATLKTGPVDPRRKMLLFLRPFLLQNDKLPFNFSEGFDDR